MQLFVALALLVISAHGSAATDSHNVDFTKADSSLTRKACSVDLGEGAVCWGAKLKLTGKLIIEFDRLPDSEVNTDQLGQAFFEPHATSRERLPEALGYYPAPIKVLWLTKNPKEILVPLLGVKRANLALHGKLAHYEYPVELVLTELTTSVECDHRNYGMSFSFIRLMTPDVVALSEIKHIGC